MLSKLMYDVIFTSMFPETGVTHIPVYEHDIESVDCCVEIVEQGANVFYQYRIYANQLNSKSILFDSGVFKYDQRFEYLNKFFDYIGDVSKLVYKE